MVFGIQFQGWAPILIKKNSLFIMMRVIEIYLCPFLKWKCFNLIMHITCTTINWFLSLWNIFCQSFVQRHLLIDINYFKINAFFLINLMYAIVINFSTINFFDLMLIELSNDCILIYLAKRHAQLYYIYANIIAKSIKINALYLVRFFEKKFKLQNWTMF